MSFRIKILLCLVLAFNVALVALSWLISTDATASFPRQGQLIDVNGTSIHVIESKTTPIDGERPSIVLLHGASTSARDFAHNLHLSLAEHFQVFSVDRPGHGYSERGAYQDIPGAVDHSQWMDPSRQARLILQTLEKRNIQNPVLLGHSWAGSVVLAAMLQSDNPVRAGILLAGATHPWTGDSAWHVQLADTPVIGPLFSWQYIAPLGQLMMKASVADVLSPDPVPDNYVENTGLALSLRPQVYQNNAEDLNRLNEYLALQAPRYPQIKAPVLSIVGSADHVVPAVSHHDKLALQLPQLQSVRLEGAGHAPHHTRAQSVSDAIVSFIQGL